MHKEDLLQFDAAMVIAGAATALAKHTTGRA